MAADSARKPGPRIGAMAASQFDENAIDRLQPAASDLV
jgi:hypothetical protein